MLEEWPRDDEEGLDALWKRLEILLEVHAEAEELFFYPGFVGLGKGAGDADPVEEEVEDAIKDHNEIREAIRPARRCKAGSEKWWEAVPTPTSPTATTWPRRSGRTSPISVSRPTLALRHGIAVQFLRYEARTLGDRGFRRVDKDPQEFVEAKRGLLLTVTDDFPVCGRSHPDMTTTPCLWFGTQGEDAARFYCSVFPNSRIINIDPLRPRHATARRNRPHGRLRNRRPEVRGMTAALSSPSRRRSRS